MTIQEKVNILLVDDRPANLLALEAVLQTPEYNLVKACSGEEALKEIINQDFAVILLDVQMPVLNGYETAKLIKKREKSKYIPIIFITAINREAEHILSGYSAGAIDYIFKPFHPETLKTKVKGFVTIYQCQEKIKNQYSLLQTKNEQLQIAHDKLKKIEEDRFNKIFQSSPCLIAIRSLEDGRYIDVNKSWLKHTGYSYDEVIGKNADFLYFTLDLPGGKEVVPDLDLKEAINNVEANYLTKLQEQRNGLISTEIIKLQDEKCILSVITDTTEKILFEQKINWLDQLNVVAEMAAGIAHEVRNPLTVVKGFLQIARNNPSRLKPEQIVLMEEELNRANSIISEFLSLTKNNKKSLALLNINNVVEAIFPLLKAEASRNKKNIEVHLTHCPDILMEENEIRQMILNLVINGLEAVAPGKSVIIRTYAGEDEVTLEVQDQGSGIKKELIEKIWSPFFTTKEKGTGIGLAVCYNIADRHNATIDLTTGSQGTTFYVRFKIESKE